MAKKEKPKARKTTKKTTKKRISPKKFTYTARDGTSYTLTERQKAFCDYYLQFGAKGVDAVYEAGYNPKNAKVAGSIASENLIKPSIFNYINSKYEEYGFNDEDVLKEHLFLIKQDGDLSSKGRGIDMYYKKVGAYSAEKVEVIKKYEDLPYAELTKLYDQRTEEENTD